MRIAAAIAGGLMTGTLNTAEAQLDFPYPRNGVATFFGAEVGLPTTLGVYAGATLARDSVGTPRPMHFYGPTVVASVGLASSSLGAGIGAVTDAGTSRWLVRVLRTYRDPWAASPHQTYLWWRLGNGGISGCPTGRVPKNRRIVAK